MGDRGLRGKREPRVTPVDLVAVALDDALLDELSAGGLPDGSAGIDGVADHGPSARCTGRHGDDAERLHRMLAAWRDDLRIRPLPGRPSATDAARVVAEARRGRSSRPVAAVAAAIVVLLVGSAIVGSRSAQPGDALFPVTQALWADQADAAVAGEQVRGALSTAHAALQAGDARRAADALATALHDLPGVRDAATHQAMQDEITRLWKLVAAAGDAQDAGSSESGGSATDGPGNGGVTPGSASDQPATGADASDGGSASDAAGGSGVAGQASGSSTGAAGDSSAAGSDGGGAQGGAGRLIPPSTSDPAPPVTAPLTTAASDAASSPTPTTSGVAPASGSAAPSSSVPFAPAPPAGSSAPVAPTPGSSTTPPADPPSSPTVSTSPGAPPTTATSDSGSATTSNTPTPSGSDAASSSADPTPVAGDPGTDQATSSALFLGAKIVMPTTTSSSPDPAPSTDGSSAAGVAMVGG